MRENVVLISSSPAEGVCNIVLVFTICLSNGIDLYLHGYVNIIDNS